MCCVTILDVQPVARGGIGGDLSVLSQPKKKKISIVIAWVLFLLILNVCFFLVESHIYDRTAKAELVEQSNAISRQLPSIVESDYYVQIASVRVIAAKLKSLAYALEQFTDFEQARPFLDEFCKIAEMESIAIYDTNGKRIYGDCSDYDSIMEAESVQAVLMSEIYTVIEDATVYNNEIYESLLQMTDTSEGSDNYFWGVGDRWLIVSKNSRTEAQGTVTDHLSRNRLISSIKVGESGFVLLINEDTGTIICCDNAKLEGQPMKELRIRDDEDIDSVDELLTLFKDNDGPVKMSIGESECYVSKLDIKGVVALVAMPTAEIRNDVNKATMILIILVIIITGLAMLYAFFHVDDADTKFETKGRLRWNRTLVGKMSIVSILAVVAVFIGVVYLEALSIYADTFSYTQSKVTRTVQGLEENNRILDELQRWSDSESLTRSRIAGCIMRHTDPDLIDGDFIQDLADQLGVRYIFRFNGDGKVVYTNSPYEHIKVDSDSPFYSMLEGRPEIVLQPSSDMFAGEYLQEAAVSFRNEDNVSDGFVMIALYPDELMAVRENLGLEQLFDQIGLSDGSYVLAVNDPDLTIEYIAHMDEGSLNSKISTYSYKGTKVTDLGVKEERLHDNYNGNMLLLEDTYFASVKRVDGSDEIQNDLYYMVMRPRVGLGMRHVAPALLAMTLTMLLMAVLVFISGTWKEDAVNEAPASAQDDAEAAAEAETAEHGDDMLSMLGKLINKSKPYFEDRWPRDSKKWRDKTPSEKFASTANYVVLFALLFIFFDAKFSGEQSVWYYCITGKWDSGINLYSITSCIISISMLVVTKIIFHKLMFLIAKVTSARSETICHLLDNFSSYGLFITGIFLCLHHFGVNATALSLTGGVAGVIFGIGCQNIVADILAGIIMTLEGSVHVGEFVSFNGQYAVVLNIGVRTTKLKWFGEVTVVRNNDFKNYIRMPSNGQNRAVCTIGIDLKESLERVEGVIERELPIIHDNLCAITGDFVQGPNYMGVRAIDGDCITLSFNIMCKGVYYAMMQRALNAELKKMFDRNGINLAMHQVVVNQPKDYASQAEGSAKEES